MLLVTAKIASALSAGNPVALEPSDSAPYAILRLAELALEAGVPAGQLAVVSGVDPQIVAYADNEPKVDYVRSPGSSATGARLTSDAALSGPRPVSLEMSKTPQVAFTEADQDAALDRRGPGMIRSGSS